MTQFQTWYLMDHFCDILQINFAEILQHEVFKDRCLKKIDLVQILFKDFQGYTIMHKDYKGFPTSTGNKRSSPADERKDLLLPRSTRLPKSHEEIDKMFKLYFTNRKNHIRDALNREIKQGPVKLVDENSIRYIDVDEEEGPTSAAVTITKQTKKRKAEEITSTSTSSCTVTRSSASTNSTRKEKATKQRKTLEEEKLFSEDTILSLKRGMKQAIIDDTEKFTAQNSRVMSRKIDQIIDQQTDIYEKKMEEYEEYKKKVARKLKEKLEYIEENYNTYLKQAKQCKTDMELLSKKRSKEIAKENAKLDKQIKELLKQ